jgi:hypothetical protein
MERDNRPDPHQHVGADQDGVDGGELAAQFRVLIVEQPGYGLYALPVRRAKTASHAHRYDSARRAGNRW